MAISKVVRPLVVLDGHVERVIERKRKADGSLYAHEVVIVQANDARTGITFYTGANRAVPTVGEFIAVEASIEESRDFGASLNYEREAFDALDRINSALSAQG